MHDQVRAEDGIGVKPEGWCGDRQAPPGVEALHARVRAPRWKAWVGLVLPGLLLGAAGLQPVNEQQYRSLVAAHAGKVLLIDFWATWCDPCREELPHLAALARTLPSKNFDLVTISSDEPEQANDALKLLREDRVPEPFYIKNAENNDHFINSIDRKWSGALPALFLYDKSGKLQRTFVGEVEMKDVESAVRALL